MKIRHLLIGWLWLATVPSVSLSYTSVCRLGDPPFPIVATRPELYHQFTWFPAETVLWQTANITTSMFGPNGWGAFGGLSGPARLGFGGFIVGEMVDPTLLPYTGVYGMNGSGWMAGIAGFGSPVFCAGATGFFPGNDACGFIPPTNIVTVLSATSTLDVPCETQFSRATEDTTGHTLVLPDWTVIDDQRSVLNSASSAHARQAHSCEVGFAATEPLNLVISQVPHPQNHRFIPQPGINHPIPDLGLRNASVAIHLEVSEMGEFLRRDLIGSTVELSDQQFDELTKAEFSYLNNRRHRFSYFLMASWDEQGRVSRNSLVSMPQCCPICDDVNQPGCEVE